MRRSAPYYCIAIGRELWFERLDFGALAIWPGTSQGTSQGRLSGGGSCGISKPSGGMLLGFYQGSASGMKMSKGQMGRRLLGLAVAGVALAAGGTAFAELGQAAPREDKVQEAASPVMESIIYFHDWLLIVITVISLFVLGLLVTVVIKFNATANQLHY